MLVLLTLAIGFVMAMIDVTAVNVALPDIALHLSVPLTGLVWVIDGYTLTFAALLLAGGALADRYGPKTIYQLGLAVFIVASTLCGLAPGGHALVAARLLQGIGAAMFMPSSLSLLSHQFTDDAQRARMLGVWSAVVATSAAFGPLVGGLLVNGFGWRSVFLINVPIGLVGIALAQVVIASTPRHEQRALSIASHLLGVVILAALSFFLIEGPALGWTSVPVLTSAVTLVVSTVALVRRERTGSHPLLAHALLNTAGFVPINITGFMINFGAFGQLFLLSLYLQQARSADALQAGLQLLPMMAGFGIGNLMAGRITARVGARVPLLVGLAVGTIGTLVLVSAGYRMPFPLLVGCVAVVNLFLGLAVPAMTTTVMKLAGRAHANSAAASLNANRQIGALVGVALVGTILHLAPEWSVRLPLAFAAFAIAYAVAGSLVHRYVGLPDVVAAHA